MSISGSGLEASVALAYGPSQAPVTLPGTWAQQRCHLLLTGPETTKTTPAAERQVATPLLYQSPQKQGWYREKLSFAPSEKAHATWVDKPQQAQQCFGSCWLASPKPALEQREN